MASGAVGPWTDAISAADRQLVYVIELPSSSAFFYPLKDKVTFATSTVRMETIFSSQIIDIESRHLSEGVCGDCEAAQRNPAKGLQSGQCRTWPPGKEAPSWHMAEKCRELANSRIWLRELTLGLCYKISSAYIHFPINMVIQKNSGNLEFLGWKVHSKGSDEARCCLFSISSPENLMNPWRKWHWTCLKYNCFDSAGNSSKK